MTSFKTIICVHAKANTIHDLYRALVQWHQDKCTNMSRLVAHFALYSHRLADMGIRDEDVPSLPIVHHTDVYYDTVDDRFYKCGYWLRQRQITVNHAVQHVWILHQWTCLANDAQIKARWQTDSESDMIQVMANLGLWKDSDGPYLICASSPLQHLVTVDKRQLVVYNEMYTLHIQSVKIDDELYHDTCTLSIQQDSLLSMTGIYRANDPLDKLYIEQPVRQALYESLFQQCNSRALDGTWYCEQEDDVVDACYPCTIFDPMEAKKYYTREEVDDILIAGMDMQTMALSRIHPTQL